MKIIISESHRESSQKVASKIIDLITAKPDALLCLAGGETPLQTYKHLVEQTKVLSLDWSEVNFIGLDEWIGVGETTKGSCKETLIKHLFEPLKISQDKQVTLFDGLSINLEHEIEKMRNKILGCGGIDLVLLGIGMNGHLGFNEPGVDPNLDVGVVALDSVTRSVGKKYFVDDITTEYGITIGIGKILESKEIILMANGVRKSKIVKKTVYNDVSNIVPSTFIRKSENSLFFIDMEAAELLKEEKYEKYKR